MQLLGTSLTFDLLTNFSVLIGGTCAISNYFLATPIILESIQYIRIMCGSTVQCNYQSLLVSMGKPSTGERSAVQAVGTLAGECSIKQLVVPKEIRTELLRQFHSSPTAGHLGVNKTLERVREILLGAMHI